MTVTVSTEALQSSSRPARQKKASLQQLTVSLPTLSLAGYEVALRASALHLQGRDSEIDSVELREVLDLPPGDMGRLLGSCCQLLRQAGRKGGMAREKLEAALVPLGLSLSLSVSVSLSVTLSAGCAGFKRDHIEILAEVIEWVRSGSPSSADSPEPPSAAAEEGEAPAPDASKCCEAEPPAAVGEQALKAQTVGRQQAVEGSEPEEPHQPAVRRVQEEQAEPEEAITPRSQATLATKYLGRLSHVAEQAARIQVESMDSDAKAAKISSLPGFKWGTMDWKERLEFLQSCPKVARATVAAQRRAKLSARLQTGPPLKAYVVVSPFNGNVLKPPAWREDEDLSLEEGDIVVSVGPAPYGKDKKGWSVGFKADGWKAGCAGGSLVADDFKIFPSCTKYVRCLRSDDVAELPLHVLEALSHFSEEQMDPTLGYTAAPRVSVEAVEVTGAVCRASTPVDAIGRQAEKTVTYYYVHCAGPARESWTVQRRYSEFEKLRTELLCAAATDRHTADFPVERIATLSFPTKHSTLIGKKLREARVSGFHDWLCSVHAATSSLGRTSYAYILLRRFLRPDAPLRQRFTGFHCEHNGHNVPLGLRVFPDTDAKATAAFLSDKLGLQAVSSSFTAQLSSFITANGRLRLEIDHLVPFGLGVQNVMVLPSDRTAEATVHRFAARVKDEFEFEISDSCRRAIVEEVKQRMQRS